MFKIRCFFPSTTAKLQKISDAYVGVNVFICKCQYACVCVRVSRLYSISLALHVHYMIDFRKSEFLLNDSLLELIYFLNISSISGLAWSA